EMPLVSEDFGRNERRMRLRAVREERHADIGAAAPFEKNRAAAPEGLVVGVRREHESRRVELGLGERRRQRSGEAVEARGEPVTHPLPESVRSSSDFGPGPHTAKERPGARRAQASQESADAPNRHVPPSPTVLSSGNRLAFYDARRS